MQNYIEVYLDIYKDYFNAPKHQNYVYNNIRAVNSNNQEEVDYYLSIMKGNHSPLLLNHEMITRPQYPIEVDRKYLLNTETLRFEF